MVRIEGDRDAPRAQVMVQADWMVWTEMRALTQMTAGLRRGYELR